jgi:O-antigen ligase
MIKDHPLLGVGLGAFPTAYPAYGRSSAHRERLEQTHNDYLQLVTDAGLVGGAIGLWFLIILILRGRKRWRDLKTSRSSDRVLFIGGYVAVLGLLVHSLTDFNLQITSNGLLFLLVVALATSHDPQRKIPE